MRINELIVAMNSLQWDIETFKKLKDKDTNYYAEAIGDIQEILLNLDRQLKPLAMMALTKNGSERKGI